MQGLKIIQKPEPGEYVPYALMYIDLVPPDGLVLTHLLEHLEVAKELTSSLSEEKLTRRCAAGEWTIKEILVHISDVERSFAYRALRFARNDATELSGIDQVLYTQYSGANKRSIQDILQEYSAVRMATLTLFNNLEEDALLRSGRVDNFRLSVRAALYILAGHEWHHLESIKENYFSEGELSLTSP